MSEDEVDVVAAELARAGGISWHPGRERGPLKVVVERYRDRARLAIAALDRYRARAQDAASSNSRDGEQHVLNTETELSSRPDSFPRIGATVLYRPPGDRRAYACRVEKIDGSRVYLVPDLKTSIGWVDIKNVSPAAEAGASQA